MGWGNAGRLIPAEMTGLEDYQDDATRFAEIQHRHWPDFGTGEFFKHAIAKGTKTRLGWARAYVTEFRNVAG